MGSVRFAASQALPFFPTLVWVRDLEPGDYEPMNRRLLAIVEDIIAPRPALDGGLEDIECALDVGALDLGPAGLVRALTRQMNHRVGRGQAVRGPNGFSGGDYR